MDTLNNLWYMARRFKLATTLNLVGLVIAFAAFYFIMTQILYDAGYNKSLKDYDQLYRLEYYASSFDEWWTNSPRASEFELAKFPQVESVSLATQKWENWQKTTFLKDGKELDLDLIEGNNTVLSTLGAKAVDGIIEWNDKDHEGVIIAESVAKTYFGTSKAAGKVMQTADSAQYTVRGVYADFAENVLPKNVIIKNVGNMRTDDNGRFSNHEFTIIAKLHKNADVKTIGKLLSKTLFEQRISMFRGMGVPEEQVQMFIKESGKEGYRLQPLTKTYFSGADKETDKGNKNVLFVLQMAAFLIIIVAAINFLNLTLAGSPMRIRGLNTRRVLGSTRQKLCLSLVGEGILTAVFACLLAIGLCYMLSKSSFSAELTKGYTQLSSHYGLLATMLLLAVVIGIVASYYPARYATSFAPAMVLKGSFGLSPKGRKLRTTLIALQIAISVFLCVYIGILYLQSRYIYTSDFGFDKDEILFMESDFEARKLYKGIENDIEKLAGVESIARSQSALGSDNFMQWGRGDGDKKINMKVMPCTWNYLRTMGIDILQGRDFQQNDPNERVIIVNEAGMKAWNWVKIGGKLLEKDENPMTVVGVCKNIRAGNIRTDNTNQPMIFLLEQPDSARYFMSTYSIRAKAGVDKVKLLQQIEDIQAKYDDTKTPEVKFLDSYLNEMYHDEMRFMHQVLVFALVCLAITLIGVFCLTMFETEYRRKEIGIRKIFGSTTGEILKMLCRQYAWIIALSFVIATPIAYIFGRHWLENFVERTPIYWWLFPLALLFIAAITLGTVIVQSWKTANENPIHSVKTE